MISTLCGSNCLQKKGSAGKRAKFHLRLQADPLLVGCNCSRQHILLSRMEAGQYKRDTHVVSYYTTAMNHHGDLHIRPYPVKVSG
jgi:hypothetical protein